MIFNIINTYIFLDLLDLDKPFFKTSAYYEGVKFLNNGGKVLCLVGGWWSGKTSTAKQIYKAVLNSSPIIISDPFTFDASKHYEPIIMDQTISKEMSQAEKEHLREKIHILFRNMSTPITDLKAFIILKIYEDRETVSEFVESLVTQNTERKFIDLSNNITRGDRTQILHSQFGYFCKNEDFNKVEQLALKGKDRSLGYPEICALFSRCKDFQIVGPLIFCSHPLKYLKFYLEKMHQSGDKNKFLILVYMSLNQNEINVNDQSDLLFEILESCNCNSTSKKTKCETEQIKNHKGKVTGETSNTEHVLYSRNRLKVGLYTK